MICIVKNLHNHSLGCQLPVRQKFKSTSRLCIIEKFNSILFSKRDTDNLFNSNLDFSKNVIYMIKGMTKLYVIFSLPLKINIYWCGANGHPVSDHPNFNLSLYTSVSY